MQQAPGQLHTFECAITHEVAQLPVFARDSVLYDLCAIDRWVAEHGTSPVTRVPLPREYYRPAWLADGYAQACQAVGRACPPLAVGTIRRRRLTGDRPT